LTAHSDFITKLLDLVEYAAKHDLEVPYLALNATVELIAPSLARKMTVGSDASMSHRAFPPAVTKPSRNLHLKVITGGLTAQKPIQPENCGY
jgi:hypothetical protein